jgi:hypothetical protein
MMSDYRDAKPVFFGHYWLPGPPELELPNALCLDFSAGKDGPLAARDVVPKLQGLVRNDKITAAKRTPSNGIYLGNTE